MIEYFEKGISFQKCPRCKSDWIFRNPYSSNGICTCGMKTATMSFNSKNNSVYKVDGVILDINKYSVYWALNGYCEVLMETTKIPCGWLSFDVTEEQLKLYLTFS